MKGKHHLGLILLLIFSISGCGTMTSIESTDSYVQYATVTVSPSIEVSGRLINVNEAIVAIVVDGAFIKYQRDSIIDYQVYMAPNPDLMQQDVVLNSKTTASNTGFFVVMTVISIVATLLLTGIP